MKLIFRHFSHILFGCLSGLFFLYPMIKIIEEFFHRHEEGHLHLHWHQIITTITNAFTPSLWPNMITYMSLCGVIAYFIGRKLSWYKERELYHYRFSQIGIKTSQIIHDQKNPMTTLINGLDFLEDNLEDAKLLSTCNIVKKATLDLNKMIDDIRLISKGINISTIHKIPTDAGPFFSAAIANIKTKSSIKLDLQYSGTIEIDPPMIEAVLSNLIKNADESIIDKRSGLIQVTVQDHKSQILIQIKDNGKGIPKKIVPKLFKLGGSFNKKGPGVGLFASKEIIKIHKGKIWIDSKENIGSTLSILLPKKL